jgi:hypothetical protein
METLRMIRNKTDMRDLLSRILVGIIAIFMVVAAIVVPHP